MEKVAIIDCGTNTFHLLIAEIHERKFKIISRKKTVAKIGEGGINNGKILESAIERAVKFLTDFKKIIDDNGITSIYAFATSAFRNAANGPSLRDKIISEVGIPLEIIYGEREAELIFKGVNLALSLANEKTLIMDIGGGSVEFIIGYENNILWKRSFEIGGQRLVELFHKHDPISLNDIKDLENYFHIKLKELFDALIQYKPTMLAGSSGTFDTLSEIYCKQNNLDYDDNNPENPFSLNAFADIHYRLISSNREERLQIPGMIAMRVDMIVVASCLINFILTRYQFDEIRVSTYSLKEGALAEMLD